MIIDREGLAWCAGFFDGEGSIGCYSAGKDYRRLSMTASQIDVAVLHKMQLHLRGNVRGPYPNDGNARPNYVWELTRFELVQQAVCCLWPWLGEVKREQAKKALIEMGEYRSTRTGTWYRKGLSNA